MARRLVSSLATFRHQNRGNVALMFGLAAIPVMLSVGAAVDYSFANRTKAVLDGIADATSLSAVGQSALAISANTEQKDAVKFFKAQAASLKRGSLGTVKVKVTDNSSGRTAVVTYTASVPTAFMGIIGYQQHRYFRVVDRGLRYSHLHRFLSVARQHAVDGRRRDAGRRHHHGRQHAGPVRLRLPRVGYFAERLLRPCQEARRHHAHRRGAQRDAAADGYRERDADRAQPVSRGDLYVRRVGGERGPDQDLSAVVQPVERENRGGQYRPDDGAVPELRQRHRHRFRHRSAGHRQPHR